MSATFPLLFVAGFAAGFINTVAGGGSVITLPILTEMLGASVANGTNRVAILIANIAAIAGFEKDKKVPWDRVRPLIPFMLVGAGSGAWVATQLSADAMKQVFAVVLLIVALSALFKPNLWLEQVEPKLSRTAASALFLVIGFYGGFVQAGAGFMLLAGLVMGSGLDLVRGSAAKVTLVASYTWLALAIFIFAGQVDFGLGLILATGNASGAYLAARLAVRKGAPWVRWVLVVAALVAAVRLATS